MEGYEVRALRKSLSLSIDQFASLVNLTTGSLYKLEEGKDEVSKCLEMIFAFLEENRKDGAAILAQRPEPIFLENSEIKAAVVDLKEKLEMTNEGLARLLHVTPWAISSWIVGRKRPGACPELLMWLLGVYSERDPNEWPSMFRPLIPARQTRMLITPERILALRKSFLMRQQDLAYLLHVDASVISQWEHGKKPGWCTNLLLRMLEAYPGPAHELLERVPYGEWEGLPEEWRFSSEKAKAAREKVGLTQDELAYVFGVTGPTISDIETGVSSEVYPCIGLVYELLDLYPEEFVGMIRT